jgi:hypothetical protein
MVAGRSACVFARKVLMRRWIASVQWRILPTLWYVAVKSAGSTLHCDTQYSASTIFTKIAPISVDTPEIRCL